MPGRAAYMDGRSGSSSMRLNFAGVPEEDIREGVRRIGRAIDEQLGLLGSLTGASAPAAPRDRSEIAGAAVDPAVAAVRPGAQPEDEPADAGEGSAQLADVVALPRRDAPASARRRLDR